ncbi:NADPH-dependent 7-cyano-7-deazaguanine reductase [Legionella massiliensis]|uniref:NADPH-dependent 7-cyano-7-deazaguanine reductase n=1 Tax=Legionella massiliensis TaxID=1034943 RepID=A0A078KWM9_9GAMM|nr:NADPH-dependent 7-cyano-7-deazaguanine reductase QueF [Legionella massiliensis]CDZ78865.1 NADPH-dependent 7-cyano-7-deazaguanine reductase [Legionella massiliensis]CEE14603.1 NADPH-dependent 7-cyano-7-deazaguanine reductase [Legionella massiliensis]
MSAQDLSSSPLGQRSIYIDNYDDTLLFPISRQPKRDAIAVSLPLPFKGYDIWTAFELSWLNEKCKPVVAIGDIIIPCNSPNIIESKSFKLYLNSFNNTRFASVDVVRDLIKRDLSKAAGAEVEVLIYLANDFANAKIAQFEGIYLDDLDISYSAYKVKADILVTDEQRVENCSVYSHLLKSNCPVTGQPDWGSISINYSGPRINNESLLQYLVSFRNHNEFHEQCVERIFMDVMERCQPETLTVYARYTRRGGLDINPIRSSEAIEPPLNLRLYRQ